MATGCTVFQQKLGNYNSKNRMKFQRNVILRRANKASENQEASMAVNLNEFDIAMTNSSKQKHKKSSKGKERTMRF